MYFSLLFLSFLVLFLFVFYALSSFCFVSSASCFMIVFDWIEDFIHIGEDIASALISPYSFLLPRIYPFTFMIVYLLPWHLNCANINPYSRSIYPAQSCGPRNNPRFICWRGTSLTSSSDLHVTRLKDTQAEEHANGESLQPVCEFQPRTLWDNSANH